MVREIGIELEQSEKFLHLYLFIDIARFSSVECRSALDHFWCDPRSPHQ